MTSAESILSLFVQRAFTFLVATRLQRLLGAPALSDIQFNSGEVDDLSLGVAMNLAQTLYPRDGPVGPHYAVRGVKRIHVFVHELVEELELLPAVLLVHTAQPDFERGRLVQRETI